MAVLSIRSGHGRTVRTPAQNLSSQGGEGFGCGSSWTSWAYRAFFIAFALLATPARAAPARAAPALVYATPCPVTLSIVIRDTIKGFALTIDRPGDRDPGPFTTRDINFAQVSRRLFFKARTAEGLIEFQGHARADALSGLFSDDRGVTRAIVLPIVAGQSRCDPRPDAHPGEPR